MFDDLRNATREEKGRFLVAMSRSVEAKALLEAGDLAGGVAAYREAIDICPRCEMRGDYQILLGQELFDQGDARGAEELLQSAATNSCSYRYEAHRRLAFSQGAQGKFDDAVASMQQAAVDGEDLAFSCQASAAFAIALGKLEAAADLVEDGAEFEDCNPDFRRRMALVRAELARLAGDTTGLLAALAQAVTLRAPDSIGIDDADVALRFAVLDRLAGRQGLRPEVAEGFADDPRNWATIAWQILEGRGNPGDLISALESASWSRRAESLAQYRYLAGLLAEHEGNVAEARRHYEIARIEPFTQWCLDYHLAGIGLERLGTA